jgi:uncharacterized protein (DUF1684 family)
VRSLFLSALILFGSFAAFSQNQTPDYETKVFRETVDKNIRNPQTTPLLPIDLQNFKGLKYFDFDAKYRIKAIFVKTTERKSFLMPTSTGGSRKYLKIGDLSFKLNGKEFSLGAYIFEWASDHPKAKEEIRDVFIPFKDLTNGEETYSAGRYVYAQIPKDGEDAILDFNLAYNPNCAYGNESFACTLPPKENFLQVEIKAGEKKFVSLSGKSTH